MAQKTFQTKELIFREGEVGDAAYVVLSGAVEILKHAEHGDVQLAVLEEGAVFGEMALFEPKNVRSASARALKETELDIISDSEMKTMIAQCPPRLTPVITTIIERLRDTNQRLAAKERATVILDQHFEQVTLSPHSPALQDIMQPVTVKVANLPFLIGGYPKGEDKPNRCDLELPSDGPPLMISQKHCQIERHSDGVFLVDLGSRFCTIVNGKVIGRGKVSNKAPLMPGENKVTLGDFTSPYKLLLSCE